MRDPLPTAVRAARGIALTSAAVLLVAACRDGTGTTDSGGDPAEAAAARRSDAFTRDFDLERCTFADVGRNTYFDLTPGRTLYLEGEDEGEQLALRITVLHETKVVGGITTRVVEERETADGELVEVSRNFFAICAEHGGVFYFGEEVDIYEDGEIVSHDGAWLHGVKGARAGLIMPGLPLLGARYFEEVVPGVALDRAEVLQLDAVLRTPARRFTNVLVTEETTPLEPDARDLKYYAPDVGLIQDGVLQLVRVDP
jgi:hypothetical protein